MSTAVTVAVSSIADYEQHGAEAYVVAANNELWMGAGVAGALKSAAGESVEQEAIAQGPIEVGDAVITSAGTVPPPARALIHAASMGFTDRTQIYASVDTVRAATKRSLERCEEHGLKSVVFPALGTGVGGLDFEDAAHAMAEAIRDHLEHGTQVERIIIAVTNEERKATFENALGDLI
ncbi:MAG: macro domain-containing protein [Chloroflexota bacterium]